MLTKKLSIILLVIIQAGCTEDVSIPFESEHLKIIKVTKNLFTHRSYLVTEEYGEVPCNGLVFFDEGEAVIFDAPTNNQAASELIDWIKESNNDINAVLATHFHEDCVGGLEEFHRNNIPSFANKITIEMAQSNNYPVPQNGFDEVLNLSIGKAEVVGRYFGAGHTADNIIAYIPSEHALFGGCLVKQIGGGKGNLEDANVEEWSETISKIKKEYPELKLVFPGHGEHGGMDLLDYTEDLFAQYQNEDPNQKDEEALIKVHQTYVYGWIEMDKEKIMALMEEDARLQPSGMAPIEGMRDIMEFWFPNDGSKTVINKFDTEIISLKIMDSLAVTTHLSMLDWNYEKGTTEFGMVQNGINTTIYKRQENQSWKIWRSMWTDLSAVRK